MKPLTTWSSTTSLYVTWLTAGHASPGTIRLRRNYLRTLAKHVGGTHPFKVTPEQLATFVGTPGWSPETRKSARAAVRSFYSWALRLEHVTRDPSAHLPPVTIPRALPRPAPQTVLEHALAGCPERELTMLMLAAYAGLRRAEIAAVHSKDLIDDRDGPSLRVHGKGGKVRIVPLYPTLAQRILAARVDRVDHYVFPGKINGHLSADRVGVLIAQRLGKGWSAHTLRHRFASKAYEVERDLRAVQELLGHSKPETTARYTAVPNNALRRAMLGSAA